MSVEYRPIEGKPGYRIGNDGSVWSCMTAGSKPRIGDKWHQLKPSPQYRGHMAVFLGRGDCRHVHRLVLETFIGPCPEGMICRHLDGNPGNNLLSNLKWGTHKENHEDSVRHGTAHLAVGKNVGTNNPTSRLSDELVKLIMKCKAEGVGPVVACRLVGLPESMRGAVDGVMRGQSWNHVTGYPKYVPKTKRVYDYGNPF